MSHRITRFIVLILFAIAMDSGIAAPPSRASLEELRETSGLNGELKDIGQTLVNGAVEEASKKSPQDETTERLIEILLAENLRESFQYSLLMDEVTYFLKKNVSEEDVQSALGWYRSDLGRRILQAEAEANSSAGMSEILRDRDELLKQQDLASMASEVDQAVGLSDAMVELQINTQKAMVLAGLAVLAPEKDLSEIEHAGWSDIKSSDRDALRHPIEQHVQATFVYTMKGFTPEERERYREYLLKPGNIKVTKAVMTGLSKAVEIGVHNFMTALANDLKNPSPELDKLLREKSSNAAETSVPAETGVPDETTNDW